MKDTSIRHAPKPTACDYQNEQEGSQKKSEVLLQSEAQNNGQENERPRVADRRKGMREEENNQCLDTSISFQAVEDLPWQPVPLEKYEQLSLWKSTPTHSLSSDITSQEYQFTPISETTTQSQKSLTSSQWDSPAQAQVTQELEQDYLTQSHLFGEKDLDVLLKLNPASVLSNSLKELSNEDFELFLADSLWQDTLGKLAMSRQQSLGRVTKDSDYLSFPTLTSGASSTTSRPAGQTKCEKWFKDNGLIPNGSQLGTKAIALTMGFPSNWFVNLREQYSKNFITPSQVKPQEESEPDISQDEQLHQDKQRSHSLESSISIPCLVKQPGQDEVKGIIRKDEGDRFAVYIPSDNSTVTISKLFVYPDFSKTVGQIDKCSSKTIPPSTNCSSKKRRQNGFGSGHIYYRTVTRNGKNYQQAYYQWRENGQQRTKYIPKKLLTKVEEAESLKLPVSEILVLLGGIDKCSSKKFDTLIASNNEKVPNCSNECSSKTITPSKKRKKGYGTGYIECKPIQRSGKKYQQYWYHYEEWRSGDRLTKKSRYIPKRLLARVEKLEAEKAPVREVLLVLGKR